MQLSVVPGHQRLHAVIALRVLIGGLLVSKDELTRIRKIGHTGITTPLIVPSYSSRGFNPVGSLFDLFSRYTTSCCLISSYDLHYTLLPMSALYSSDVSSSLNDRRSEFAFDEPKHSYGWH